MVESGCGRFILVPYGSFPSGGTHMNRKLFFEYVCVIEKRFRSYAQRRGFCRLILGVDGYSGHNLENVFVTKTGRYVGDVTSGGAAVRGSITARAYLEQ